MATTKLATLIIRTLAKPISNRIKEQARQHERFRGVCVGLAQFMYRSEVKLRTGILGETAKHVRPLSETKAIENGANALAEGFLFAVAPGLIIGETWRSARSSAKRRDGVDEQLEALGARLGVLGERVEALAARWEEEGGFERERNDELARILERVVEIGLRGGWAEFAEADAPVQLSVVRLAPPRRRATTASHFVATCQRVCNFRTPVRWVRIRGQDVRRSEVTLAITGCRRWATRLEKETVEQRRNVRRRHERWRLMSARPLAPHRPIQARLSSPTGFLSAPLPSRISQRAGPASPARAPSTTDDKRTTSLPRPRYSPSTPQRTCSHLPNPSTMETNKSTRFASKRDCSLRLAVDDGATRVAEKAGNARPYGRVLNLANEGAISPSERRPPGHWWRRYIENARMTLRRAEQTVGCEKFCERVLSTLHNRT